MKKECTKQTGRKMICLAHPAYKAIYAPRKCTVCLKKYELTNCKCKAHVNA